MSQSDTLPQSPSVSGKKEQFETGSMFAGIGGICLSFKNAGARMVWANEIDESACKTYRLNLGSDYLVQGDIKAIDSSDIPDMDILTAGFPCQAFSIAGYRKGFEDERGALFFEIMRVINAKRPRAVFIENVKNLVKHDKGNTFNNIIYCLKDSGYMIKHAILNTKDYGNVPQNRERIYIVGFRNESDYKSFEFPSETKLTNNIHDITDRSEKKEDYFYYGKSSKYYTKLEEGMTNPDTVYQWRRVYLRENMSGVCPTLTANMGTGGHNVPLIKDDHGIRKLTPEECMGFQGFPKCFKFPDIARSMKYKQAGNSVSVPVVTKIAQNIITAMELSDSVFQ